MQTSTKAAFARVFLRQDSFFIPDVENVSASSPINVFAVATMEAIFPPYIQVDVLLTTCVYVYIKVT